ncbi:hypothetical protein B0H10DRAFT_1951196 [Mycena sp. CBHHK59/15]|nr:hypothetical protein B0H10DRAFT_1951196 [Mycena sp. CBHHK59/15]
MRDAVTELYFDDDHPLRKRKPKPAAGKGKGTGKGKKKAESDPDDTGYSRSGLEDNSDSDAEAKVTHEELADSLPAKTVPAGQSRIPTQEKKKRKKRKTADTPTSNVDQSSKPAAGSSELAEDGESMGPKQKPNPIWKLFDNVTKTEHARKSEAEKGDRFFQCFHGELKKVHKITTAMKSSINGIYFFQPNYATDKDV